MASILDGIRILECAVMHNGPAAAYMLGDLGAEVIKVEDPVTGDLARGMGSMFDTAMGLPGGGTVQYESANRNKKGITLDLTKEKGREVLYRLVQKSDVFLTNFRQRVRERLGIDYPTLRQHNPRLIYALATTYGSRGPWQEKRGFDPVAQALTGAMYSWGDRDEPDPSQAVGGFFDSAGATLLAYGILGALFARERTGKGQELESSLMGAAAHLQGINFNALLWRGRPMIRHTRKRSRNPMCNHYRCADDKWIMVMETQSDRYWHDFCKALGLGELERSPDFATANDRRGSSAALVSILDKVFASRTREEWLRELEPYDFVYAPVYDLDEAADEPQLRENEYIVSYDHPTMGPTRTAGFPVRFSETPARIQCGAPQFGQHTEEVLMQVGGYTWEEIATLKEEGLL